MAHGTLPVQGFPPFRKKGFIVQHKLKDLFAVILLTKSGKHQTQKVFPQQFCKRFSRMLLCHSPRKILSDHSPSPLCAGPWPSPENPVGMLRICTPSSPESPVTATWLSVRQIAKEPVLDVRSCTGRCCICMSKLRKAL